MIKTIKHNDKNIKSLSRFNAFNMFLNSVIILGLYKGNLLTIQKMTAAASITPLQIIKGFGDIRFNNDKISKDKIICEKAIRKKYIIPKLFLLFLEKNDVNK